MMGWQNSLHMRPDLTLASIIGTLYIAVVVFLAVYWTFKPPRPAPDDNEHPVSILFDVWEIL